MANEDLITVQQAATMLHLATDTLYKYVESRRIPHYKIGNRIRFSLDDLHQWLATKAVRTGNNK